MASRRKKNEPGFSRRTFLKTVSAGGMAAGVLGPAASSKAQGVNAVGPGAVPIHLDINGRVQKLDIEPRVTLLDAMRTRLEMTGVKRVCDRGACGACTVIVDGKTVYACSILAIDAQGKTIRTVEGLTEGTVLHPVQQAFCDHDGLMCGFCTPGFVVAAAALLEENPKPTPDQARKALDGNICRCGTYVRVLDAALDPAAAVRGPRAGVQGIGRGLREPLPEGAVAAADRVDTEVRHG